MVLKIGNNLFLYGYGVLVCEFGIFVFVVDYVFIFGNIIVVFNEYYGIVGCGVVFVEISFFVGF